jgi:hypothetical protein
MTNRPAFLTTEALAERWGLSVGSLANMRVRGTGPTYFKIGASVRYSLGDIEQYEAAGRTEAVA